MVSSQINLLASRCVYLIVVPGRQADRRGRRSESVSVNMAGGLASGPGCRSPSASVIQRDDIIKSQSINRDEPSVVT